MDPGRMLRAARRTRRLSQRELAALAGVPNSTVGRIEAGRSDPKLATFATLLRAVGYDLVVCDEWSRLLTVDETRERLVDRIGRRFPSHLESSRTPDIVQGGWWGYFRIAWWPKDAPEYTYRKRSTPPQLGSTIGRQEVWDDAT